MDEIEAVRREALKAEENCADVFAANSSIRILPGNRYVVSEILDPAGEVVHRSMLPCDYARLVGFLMILHANTVEYSRAESFPYAPLARIHASIRPSANQHGIGFSFYEDYPNVFLPMTREQMVYMAEQLKNALLLNPENSAQPTLN